jgi:opacity protein-like surface antigen
VATDDLFTAGGALGVALDRDNGQLRLEVEGRGREAFLGTTGSVFDPFQYDVEASDGWSVTAHAWRDYFLGERWGAYVGGGLGGGGYRLFVSDDVATGSGPVGGFAWQAGGGVIWEVTDRMTLDVGYRWFAIDMLSTPLALSDGAPAGAYTSAFGASELLLTVRVYEPFRRWIR